MATLTVVSALPTSSGFQLNAVQSSSNGDKWLNTGKEIVIFQNSSSQAGSAVTATFAAQQIDNYGGAASLHNISITVPSTSYGMLAVGPFPTTYNDASGFCNITYTAGGAYVMVVSVAPRS